MFPRTDGVLLGGTFEPQNASLAVDRETEKRIVAAHAQFFDSLPHKRWTDRRRHAGVPA